MKQVIATFGLLAIAAAAQDKAGVYLFSSPVMGKTVKGAPYSADEITESLQVLSDGTRISHQSQTTVYRDSEGRVRREGPGKVVIFDPVAGFSYTLDPVSKTAMKSIMGTLVDHTKKFFVMRSAPGPKPDPATQSKADLDKLKAEMAAQLEQASAKLAARGGPPPHEDLGQRVIDGIAAKGTLTVETVLAGAIGNDRPFRVLDERWVSTDLQTALLTRHTDPRSGEETFRLTNVQRSEPATDLFMVPADYQVVSSSDAMKKE